MTEPQVAVPEPEAPTPASNMAKVTTEWQKIPVARRDAKRFMTLLGILLIELAVVSNGELWPWWRWSWPSWTRWILFGFGCHAFAGDYRRLVIDWITAALKDGVGLAGSIAEAAKAVRAAIASVLGKNGNGSS